MTRIRLGVMAHLTEEPGESLKRVRALAFPTCQVSCWDERLLTDAIADKLRQEAQAQEIEITTLWTGSSGRYVWDFIDGPNTIGLVPPATRAARLATVKSGSDFAQRAGIPSITTHVGFIPENPGDPLYPGLIAALQEVADHCGGNGQSFWFETGQETPTALLRTIQDAGRDNLGINLDPANLLMYGKANPLDALDIIGTYVRGVHAKDGEYPTNGRHLGPEKPLGEGRVNFPLLIARLRTLGFEGALTIEREITGPQQIEDIKQGKRYLEGILLNATPDMGRVKREERG